MESHSLEKTAGPKPRLIYDGDCGFCVYWARYWQKLTGSSVEYRPYQEVASEYPKFRNRRFNARFSMWQMVKFLVLPRPAFLP